MDGIPGYEPMGEQDKQHPTSARISKRPIFWGLVTFILLGILSALLVYLEYKVRRNESDRHLFTVAETIRSRLQQSLQYSLSATQTMALTINREGVPVNFDSVAKYVLSYNKFIDALQLAPKGVIQYVYPLEPHRAVIGHDVLSDPRRRKEALVALERKELFFAGPFELKQGGLGVVGRLPVFIDDKFWGFSAVVIRINTLLAAAGIDSSGTDGYHYQLSKINPETGLEEFFLPLHPNRSGTYSVAVNVPDGKWRLTVSPVSGPSPFQSTYLLATLGLLFSILGGIFVYNRSKEPVRLQKLVIARTKELKESERRNKAIVNALPDMIFVINEEDKFVDYNNPMGSATMVAPIAFLNKKVTEVLAHDLALETLRNKRIVLEEQRILTHSYHMLVDNETRYYEARYAPQSKTDVLILVRDVTESFQAEQRIRESEIKYRTLVEQASDAIFIADLQGKLVVVNPAGALISQYTLEELLTMRIHELTVQEELAAMPFRMHEVASGGVVTSERKLKRKDGSLIDVEITAKLIAADRFLAFVRDISERKRVEQELLKSREELRGLSNYIENVREQERLHISREIHDELGQHLTVLKMDVSRLAKKISGDNEYAVKDFNDILDAINDMVVVVRRISSELRPGLIDDLGLIAAIDWYCMDFEKRTGIKTSFHSSVLEEELPTEHNIGIFRIFQESLTNVVRHANATEMEISLVKQENQLVLLIEDNGKGFEQRELQKKKTLGILGMKERAKMMAGSYTIQSGKGKGTVVEVVIPLESII